MTACQQGREFSEVFVVIPAYEEASALAAAIDPLLELGYSVVVVDDGSADETWAVAAGLGVHAVRHCVNLGQGAALQTGTSYSLACGARYIVHFDGDGQHSAEEIESLLAPLRDGRAVIALGSRFKRAQDIAAVPPRKRVLLRLAVLVNWVLTGVRLTDAHNGFRALSRRAASVIDLRSNRFEHATELLDQIREQELSHIEVPTLVRYTEYSMAKGQSMWNALNILFDFALGRLFR